LLNFNKLNIWHDIRQMFWHRTTKHHCIMDREIPKSEQRRTAMRKWLRALWVVIPVACAAGAAMIFATPSVERSSLTVAEVTRGTIETAIGGTGRVVPAFEMIINSPITSRIVEVYRKAGDTLSTGTPLLRLDLLAAETELNRMADERRHKVLESEQTGLTNRTYLSDLEMQVKVKAMNADRLQQEVANERRLDSIGSGTGERVREAELAYNTARLELEQLRTQLTNERASRSNAMKMKQLELSIFDKNLSEKQRTLEDAKLRAPRRATLTYIADEVGRQVNQGEKVAVIADLSHFKVTGEVTDANADVAMPGAGVIVKIGSATLNGHIAGVEPLSKNGMISFDVTLDDDTNPRLRSGLKTQVFVLSEVHDDAVRIPFGPFFHGPGNYDLFVVEGDRLNKHRVKLGDSSHDFIEVVEGLTPGQRVVTSPLNNLEHKSSIKLKN